MKHFSLGQILQKHSDLFQILHTPKAPDLIRIDGVVPPETRGITKLSSACFVSTDKNLQDALIGDLPLALFVPAKWSESSSVKELILQNPEISWVTFKNIQVSMALILQELNDLPSLRAMATRISPLSFIDPSAQIAGDAYVGPFCSIGARVIIESGAWIGPNCTIEGDSKIGAMSILLSHVYLGARCEIGAHCEIKPFASIGSDGYGFAPTSTNILKIPQIGRVVLEDFVSIGSGTCIDRATLTETRVGQGSKLDNLVHIAHNCRIGKYCLITAGFATAGSTTIDDFFVCGGQVAVADHVHITSRVTLAGASVVTNDIEESGAYGGYPIQPMVDYLKTRSSIAHLADLRKKIGRIIKHLDLK